jgi:hypothetical protein
MKGPTPNKLWLRLAAGLSCTVLAEAFLTPGRLNASSGGHITPHCHQDDRSQSGDNQTVPAKRPSQQQPQTPKRKPCPYCNGGETPAPPPPSTAPVRIQDWVSVLKAAAGNSNDPFPLWLLQGRHTRIHRTVRIYHPPRSL